jgi:DNA-binding Lrp family transcriptional regulator
MLLVGSAAGLAEEFRYPDRVLAVAVSGEDQGVQCNQRHRKIRRMGGHTLEAQDAQTVEHFEQSLAQAEEVIDLRRLFSSRGYFVRVAVADLAAYETFLSNAS